MRSRFFVVFTLIFAVLAVISVAPAFGQGNIAVLFDGTALVGKTSFLKDSGGLNNMEAKINVFPGAEVRFNQDGRVTLGVGYQRWELKQDATHVSLPVFRQGRELLVSWDESSDATSHAVLATIYVNITTRGKVRPFIGGGGGVGLFRVSDRILNIIDVSPPFFESGSTNKKSVESRTNLMLKGVAGLNIYPVKHFVLSLGSGYVNGFAVSLGGGFTF